MNNNNILSSQMMVLSSQMMVLSSQTLKERGMLRPLMAARLKHCAKPDTNGIIYLATFPLPVQVARYLMYQAGGRPTNAYTSKDHQHRRTSYGFVLVWTIVVLIWASLGPQEA